MVSTTSQYADTRANSMSIWTDGKSAAWRSWMNMIGPSGTGPVYIRKDKLVISMPSGARHGAGPSPGTNLTTNIFVKNASYCQQLCPPSCWVCIIDWYLCHWSIKLYSLTVLCNDRVVHDDEQTNSLSIFSFFNLSVPNLTAGTVSYTQFPSKREVERSQYASFRRVPRTKGK